MDPVMCRGRTAACPMWGYMMLQEVGTMDCIKMMNMRFYGHHGVLPEEQQNGQDFLIDVEISADLRKAAQTDDLADSVDYSQVYGIIKNITKNNVFRLIERLADNIAREILTGFDNVREVAVRVKKPEAPLTGAPPNGGFDWVGVEVRRTRDDF